MELFIAIFSAYLATKGADIGVTPSLAWTWTGKRKQSLSASTWAGFMTASATQKQWLWGKFIKCLENMGSVRHLKYKQMNLWSALPFREQKNQMDHFTISSRSRKKKSNKFSGLGSTIRRGCSSFYLFILFLIGGWFCCHGTVLAAWPPFCIIHNVLDVPPFWDSMKIKCQPPFCMLHRAPILALFCSILGRVENGNCYKNRGECLEKILQSVFLCLMG